MQQECQGQTCRSATCIRMKQLIFWATPNSDSKAQPTAPIKAKHACTVLHLGLSAKELPALGLLEAKGGLAHGQGIVHEVGVARNGGDGVLLLIAHARVSFVHLNIPSDEINAALGATSSICSYRLHYGE